RVRSEILCPTLPGGPGCRLSGISWQKDLRPAHRPGRGRPSSWLLLRLLPPASGPFRRKSPRSSSHARLTRGFADSWTASLSSEANVPADRSLQSETSGALQNGFAQAEAKRWRRPTAGNAPSRHGESESQHSEIDRPIGSRRLTSL